jgi:hypothetical protein
MRIPARAWLPAALLSTLVAGGPLRTVAAANVAYNFSGRIQTVSQAATNATGVVVGDTITGSFVYDPTQTGSITTGLYTFTGSSKIHTFTFKIFDPTTGSQVFTDSYSGNASAYYAAQLAFSSTAGTTLDLLGDTIYKQGLGITGPSIPAFDLRLFNPTNAGGYTATHLPLPDTTLIRNFTPNTGLLTWDPPDQTFTATVEFEEIVPEPASLVTGLLGLLTSTAGCWIFRRKLPRVCRPAA